MAHRDCNTMTPNRRLYHHGSQQTFAALRHHIVTGNTIVLNSLWVFNYALRFSRTSVVTTPWEKVTSIYTVSFDTKFIRFYPSFVVVGKKKKKKKREKSVERFR